MSLKTGPVTDILTVMSVSTRKFLRYFPAFRERAERGETVLIESRAGVKFVFHRIGDAPRPRRVEVPLPRKITDQWDFETPAAPASEWEMNG